VARARGRPSPSARAGREGGLTRPCRC
jgi:hypothetical protein